MSADSLSRRTAFWLLFVLIFAWGLNWVSNKATLDYVTPVWATFFRTGPALLIMTLLCLFSGRLVRPVKADLPIIFSVGWLHMVGFSVLVSIGLQYLPAGLSIVLAYTTPLWVLPASRIFLKEPFGSRQILGLVIGMAGLAVILRPDQIDWSDRDVLLGHGLILLAAFSWAICIVYGRSHRFVTPTFELLPWQMLLAGATQLVLAFVLEGVPRVEWNLKVLSLLGFSSIFGTVLAYWIMNTVNRGLPASITSMALLAVPIMGLICSALILNESISLSLWLATALIIGGIALATSARKR